MNIVFSAFKMKFNLDEFFHSFEVIVHNIGVPAYLV